MHSFFSRFLKTLLRFLFFVICSAFMFGLVKFKFHMQEYVGFLNTLDVRTLFSGFTSPALPSALPQETGTIDSGLDVYDPNFEQEFMDISTGNLLSGDVQTGQSYGFQDPYSSGSSNIQQSPSSVTGSLLSGDSRKELLNLIKREK